MHEIDAVLKDRISPNRRGSDMLDTLFAKFQLFVAGEAQATVVIVVDHVVIESIVPKTDFAHGLHVEGTHHVIERINYTPLFAGPERLFSELQKLFGHAWLRAPVMMHVETHIVIPASMERRVLRRGPMHWWHRMHSGTVNYWRRSWGTAVRPYV